MNTEKTTTGHITVKVSKMKTKGKIVKVNRLIADFSTKMMEARRQLHDILLNPGKSNSSPRILCPDKFTTLVCFADKILFEIKHEDIFK